jgi:hypothetical protein
VRLAQDIVWHDFTEHTPVTGLIILQVQNLSHGRAHICVIQERAKLGVVRFSGGMRAVYAEVQCAAAYQTEPSRGNLRLHIAMVPVEGWNLQYAGARWGGASATACEGRRRASIVSFG